MYRTTEMTAAFARSQLSRLDDTLAVLRQNAAYLTEGLDGSSGFLTPVEPADSKHAFFRYSIHFTPERLGIDLPIAEFAAKVRAALAAEGVKLGRGEFVIPGMTLFQEKRGYGKGCPWSCGFYGGSVDYRVEDYPVASDTIHRIVALIGLTPPNGIDLMDRYVEAVHKVFGHIEEVLAG